MAPEQWQCRRQSFPEPAWAADEAAICSIRAAPLFNENWSGAAHYAAYVAAHGCDAFDRARRRYPVCAAAAGPLQHCDDRNLHSRFRRGAQDDAGARRCAGELCGIADAHTAHASSWLQSLDEQTMTSRLLQTDTAKGPIWSAAGRTDTFV
jgi:hypothetical protein